MNSRMEKYGDEPIENMSRSARNRKIYSSIDFDDISSIRTNNNVSVISDAEKEIDIEKIKKYINSINEEKIEKRKRISLELPQEEHEEITKEELKQAVRTAYTISDNITKRKNKRDRIIFKYILNLGR